ncbi:MAG: hypothetical protein J0L92_33815 [Deltaproteobacteria bacterium]|nr:hypothetical protein [Deltaproteobacteria bacterium]
MPPSSEIRPSGSPPRASSRWSVPPGLTRSIARAALLAGLLLAGLAIRAWSSCSEELARADEAREGGDVESAIDHYRRAAVWYFPGNVRARAALEALMEIGEDARTRGDATLALAAYRSVHGATMSARHVVVPHDDLRARADEEIATLMAEGTVPPIDAHRTPDERRSVYLAMLREDRDVRTVWALLALFGFAAWVTGAAVFLGRGFDASGDVIAREARRWGTVFVVGLGLFVLGLVLA